MADENYFDDNNDSYEQIRVKNTLDLRRMQLRLKIKQKSDSLFGDVKKKLKIHEVQSEFLPTFDHSDSESETETNQNPPKLDKNPPNVIVVDESAKPVADGDKAEQKKSAKKEPAKDVCFHKFQFSSFSQISIFIVL
jgi:hypothetical protein